MEKEKYESVNILDIMKISGEGGVKNDLSDFSCPTNTEIEHFVRNNSIEFAKKKMSITYLVLDAEHDSDLAGIGSLTHKSITIIIVIINYKFHIVVKIPNIFHCTAFVGFAPHNL